MPRIPFLDLRPQTRALAADFLSAAGRLLEQNQFIGGAPVADFERAFGRYCGDDCHCVALNSGTDALRLALSAWGISGDDEVITSPFTFIATAEAVTQNGRLVLADVDPGTFTLSPSAVEGQAGPSTRAVIPVHIFGLPADMPALVEQGARRGWLILEDACQAHGAAIGSRRAGTWGQAGAFSFYPSKNLGAFGDAGALVSCDPELAERVRLLRNHGQVAPYSHIIEGHNSRMDALQASLLHLKLPYLDRWNEERRRLLGIYRLGLADVSEIQFQRIPEGYLHACHIAAVLVEKRDELCRFLSDQGIETRVIYPVPIHLMPAYRRLGYCRGDFPNCERICDSVVCLPLYPGLEEGQVEFICAQIRRFYGYAG
jgi:dTDP-4-amino-4,6-dideoxygalactose transaminase